MNPNKTQLKAVIFDFDGTIVNTEILHFEAIMTALKPYAIKRTYSEYLEHFGGAADEEALKGLLSQQNTDFNHADITQLLIDKTHAFNTLIKTVDPITPGLHNLLEALHQNNIALAICTNAFKNSVKNVLARFKQPIGHYFTVIISREDVIYPKPHPEGYELALSSLGVKAENSLVFEDSLTGITAAKSANIKTIGICTNYPANKLTEADKTITSFNELTLEDMQSLLA